MSHFAKLDANNVVVAVYAGSDSDDGKEQELSERTGDIYKQTSYNTRGGIHINGGTPFRKNYAGIGYTYDPIRDAFIPPKPHPSWSLDDETCWWIPPIPYPTDGQLHTWDEKNKKWVLVD